MFDNIGVGNQIALLRKRNGLTQEELAEKLGITAQAVSKWENGHTMPETSMLPLLSKLLNSSVDSILLLQEINFITNIEEIIRIDKQKARQLLENVDKTIIAKALKGVSPATGEYLRELFSEIDLIGLCNEIGPIRVSEMDEIHMQLVNIINQK